MTGPLSAIGPLRSATVLCPDLDAALPTYLADLDLQLQQDTLFDADDAKALQLGELAGQRLCWLGSEHAPRWLRLINAPQAAMNEPMQRHGWLALEVLVADCAALVASLGPSWRVLGAPALLEVSPDITASQVLGPSGELYYFTEVRAAVPPFDLPMTRARVDRPFIAVLSTPAREAAARAFEQRAGLTGWRLDTRITVLNRALSRPLATQYPVAVVPLAGQSLIEIDEVELDQTQLDQVPQASTVAPARHRQTSGLHSITLSGPPNPPWQPSANAWIEWSE